MAVSFSYLLPVSTPSNAIVFAYGDITVPDMVRGTHYLAASSFLMYFSTNVPLLVFCSNVKDIAFIVSNTLDKDDVLADQTGFSV